MEICADLEYPWESNQDAMSPLESEKTAKRDSWKAASLPESHHNLGFQATFTLDEFEDIKRGLIPKGMEDKWFIFFEPSWLYFHRSWTGECAFAIRFEVGQQQVTVVESWVGGKLKDQPDKEIAYAKALLAFLIDAFLLRKSVSFPVQSNLPVTAPRGIYQHAVVGRGYPEVVFPVGPPVIPSFRMRLRHMLQKQWNPFRFRKIKLTRWIRL